MTRAVIHPCGRAQHREGYFTAQRHSALISRLRARKLVYKCVPLLSRNRPAHG